METSFPGHITTVDQEEPLAKWGEVKIVNPVARFPPHFLRVAASSNQPIEPDLRKLRPTVRRCQNLAGLKLLTVFDGSAQFVQAVGL